MASSAPAENTDHGLDKPPENGPGLQSTDSQTEQSGRRQVKPTEKAKALYDATINRFMTKLNGLYSIIEQDINMTSEFPDDKDAVVFLKRSADEYFKEGRDYSDYLKRQNTSDSKQDLSAHETSMKEVRQKVDNVLSQSSHVNPVRQKNNQKEQNVSERGSVRSKRSHRSYIYSDSHMSQKLANLEGARVKLEFANKEAELMKEKAKLEAEKLVRDAEINA